MLSIKIDVYVTVVSMEEAEDIAHDLHEFLNNNGITNSTNVTNDISY